MNLRHHAAIGLKGKAGDTPFATVFQFTDTMVQRDGKWRFAASHVSRIP